MDTNKNKIAKLEDYKYTFNKEDIKAVWTKMKSENPRLWYQVGESNEEEYTYVRVKSLKYMDVTRFSDKVIVSGEFKITSKIKIIVNNQDVYSSVVVDNHTDEYRVELEKLIPVSTDEIFTIMLNVQTQQRMNLLKK